MTLRNGAWMAVLLWIFLPFLSIVGALMWPASRLALTDRTAESGLPRRGAGVKPSWDDGEDQIGLQGVLSQMGLGLASLPRPGDCFWRDSQGYGRLLNPREEIPMKS